MHKNLEEVEITIFDTETTGLQLESGDRIVEIAALRIKGKERLGKFQTLVNPLWPISEAAFKVNRITDQMLKEAPRIDSVMPEFLTFIQGSCLCSYNAGFDLGFLNNELNLMGKPALENIVVVDILKMAKRLLPGLERYALWFVAEKLGIKIEQEHRAFSDAELTFQVFNKLKERLYAKGIDDFVNFSSLFGLQSRFLSDANSQKIALIEEAIELQLKLKIKYFSVSSDEISEREVLPKEIRETKEGTYLVGYCYLKNQERTFRIDGILHLEIV